MRKRLITEVLIIRGDQGEQSEKSLCGSLSRETNPLFTFGSFTFITSGKVSPIMQYGDGEGVGSPVFSNRNQLLILRERILNVNKILLQTTQFFFH